MENQHIPAGPADRLCEVTVLLEARQAVQQHDRRMRIAPGCPVEHSKNGHVMAGDRELVHHGRVSRVSRRVAADRRIEGWRQRRCVHLRREGEESCNRNIRSAVHLVGSEDWPTL